MNLAVIPKPLIAALLALPVGAFGWSKATGQPISALPGALKSAASNALGQNGKNGRPVIAGGGGGGGLGRRLSGSPVPGSPATPTMFPTAPLTVDPATGQVNVPPSATGSISSGITSASLMSSLSTAAPTASAAPSTYSQAFAPATYDQWSSAPKGGPDVSWTPGANDTYIVNAQGATQVPYGTMPTTFGNIATPPPVGSTTGVPHGAAVPI